MDNKETTEKTLWHQILGRIFKFLLPPLGITVFTDVKVLIKPPEADILLLKRKDQNWTEAQLERLPDGIRESRASHILIEFKATQSLSKETFTQAAAYEYFYKQSQKLADDEIQTFVISAIQPQQANRVQYGYKIRVQPGIYQSDLIAFNHITLISLNELPDELHNAWITCLASKKLKRLKAFKLLQSQGFQFISKPFLWFLADLWQKISDKGDDDMALDLSPQDIKKMGEMWGSSLFTSEDLKDLFDTLPVKERRTFVSNMPLEEWLMELKPEERLKGLKPEERRTVFSNLPLEERLMSLKPEERLMDLKPEERLKGLKPEERRTVFSNLPLEERLMDIKPEERLKDLKPEERLTGLSAEEIEAYLKSLTKK